MAEESAAERTEEATERKRQQSRERGQLPKSKDLSAAIVVFVAVVFLRYGGGMMAGELMGAASALIEQATTSPLPHDREVLAHVPLWVSMFLQVIAPFMAVLFVAALVAGFGQVGFVLSAEAVNIKWGKLNPVEGAKRMFKLRSLMTLLMSMGKVALVLAVAWPFFRAELFAVPALSELSSAQIVTHMTQACLDLMLRIAAILLILALLDLWYQRYQWEQDLRMTKQEVKEEMRDTEGDPHVRSRRRQIQRQMAMQRMMSEVPDADVVVKNPTHYAVALRYDPQKAAEPFIVAKGMNNVALRIIKLAIEHGVPVKYEPKLARELHKLEIGDLIPKELYQAVAEVLAWVVRTGRSKRLSEGLAASA